MSKLTKKSAFGITGMVGFAMSLWPWGRRARDGIHFEYGDCRTEHRLRSLAGSKFVQPVEIVRFPHRAGGPGVGCSGS